MDGNQLFFGDNLEVLRQHVKDDSVDLVYLDPPFNSNADYNILFDEHDGTQAASQIKAFYDTWHWDQVASREYEVFVTAQHAASQALEAFRSLLGCNDMLAYLSMMAPRLVELRRVLKPTGSIYLHCDPTASHYLKILLDSIFGKEYFRNEIIWKRTSTHSSAKRCGPVHDVILFYSKSHFYTWNPQYDPHPEAYRGRHDLSIDKHGKVYRLSDMTGAGTRSGASGATWRGFDPTKMGRHWITTPDKLEEYVGQGLVYFPPDGKWPRLIRYQDQSKGCTIGDVWDNISPINSKASERLGYPTQKPEALLSRIIKASSNEHNIILDPFCGCGTAVAVAQRLNRKWIGIDITHLAIALIKTRLRDAYGPEITKAYKVFGEPVSLPDARALAIQDRYQFQYWALGLLGARPVAADQKKGADKGVDGRLAFHDDMERTKVKRVIFSVKSGHLKSEHVRELPGILDREKAQIAVLITLQPPTPPMKTEAASAGFYQSPWGTKHPRIQILTVEEILAGKQVDLPPSRDIRTFKKAPKAKKFRADYYQKSLITGEDDPARPIEAEGSEIDDPDQSERTSS